MSNNNATLTQSRVLSAPVNRVLRNTYILLSISLAFSALMATLSARSGAASLGFGITLIGYAGLLFLVNALRNSSLGILAVFAFTGFFGWTAGTMLSSVLSMSNGPELITMALGGTAAIFFAMSGIVLFTKRDFGFLGNFLLVGLIAMIVLIMANLFFLQLPILSVAISAMVILLFSGFILWETSDIIQGRQTNYIMATVSMYLSIYNIFVNLLSLLGIFGSE